MKDNGILQNCTKYDGFLNAYVSTSMTFCKYADL